MKWPRKLFDKITSIDRPVKITLNIMTIEDLNLTNSEAKNLQDALKDILQGEKQASEMEQKLDQVEKNLDMLLKQLESFEDARLQNGKSEKDEQK